MRSYSETCIDCKQRRTFDGERCSACRRLHRTKIEGMVALIQEVSKAWDWSDPMAGLSPKGKRILEEHRERFGGPGKD